MNAYEYPGNGKTLLYAMTSLLFGLAFAVGGPYLLNLELDKYAILMDTLPPLFTRHTGAAGMYAAPLGGLVFLILAFMIFYRLFLGKPAPQKLANGLIKFVSVLAIVALISLFLARFVANSYWEHTFRQAGYARCPNSFFLTSQWFVDAWALDPAFCRDQEVQRMMTSTKFKVEDVNNYLRERKPFHSL
ncbi:MAG: hypothetical protein WED00_05165 [Aquisalimonadaceae bacterium]